MCGLFQPIGQVRLTNVATVRLKTGGKKFEIACYKNKVVNWRSGVETDIQEVLQTPCIFTSITKGKLAKNDELLEAFGTKDIDTICKQILDKGEMQVSKEERNQMLQAMFKDVVTILSELAINPKTGRALTSTLIENTLKSSAFSVSLREPAKKQALKALAHLQQLYPNEIARSQMRLKITCAMNQRDDVLQFLSEQNAYIEHVDHSQAKSTPGNRKAKDSRDDNHQRQDAVVNIRFLCCTKIYRTVDDYISNTLQPPGSLQLVALNVKDAGNRGLSQQANALDTASNVPTDDATPNGVPLARNEDMSDGMEKLKIESPEEQKKVAPPAQEQKKAAFKCTNCVLEFNTAGAYRQHCKSELHVINNKLALKGLPPVSEQDLVELELCRKNASLDD
ncbi:SBDS family rRNA metabolism protein [Babesia bovis T2Bo]|uniref:C2H2-type domain-containing protein n=1 Tax=Babesia bovis TaxID=5865 RepID=A7AQT3_BABBO|nr:SBDS family rRNA metabolism protein [Babesia bovis T2Bo]EDO06902.1 SBDS family rRNA metabolism protein [Babesia bovis T2Bo]|eukprot:XP_001610470.1 hypothetical protein [Babesia bovis T2Bo]